MTRVSLDRWLAGSTHYRMHLFGDAADNPDHRIADDINQFIEKSLNIVVRLLGAITRDRLDLLRRADAHAPLAGRSSLRRLVGRSRQAMVDR